MDRSSLGRVPEGYMIETDSHRASESPCQMEDCMLTSSSDSSGSSARSLYGLAIGSWWAEIMRE